MLNQKCLFIGGPFNCKFKNVELRPVICVPIKPPVPRVSLDYIEPEKIKYEIVEYKKHKIYYQELYFLDPKGSFVYVKPGVKWGFG